MADYHNWTLNINEHVARLTMNRSMSMNSLTMDTLYELADICDSLNQRKEIWVVVLQGEGDHFSSGIDQLVFKDLMKLPRETILAQIADQQRCVDMLEGLSKVTIARIQGFCIGGGLILALACDFRIASERSIFSLPEVKLGIPITWGTMRVVRTIGVPKAKEMIMLGKKYRASDALQIGLVHRVIQPDKLDLVVNELADKLLGLPPHTLLLTKKILATCDGMSLLESQALELELFGDIIDSHDLSEAIDSYFSQRSPQFTAE